MSTPTFLAGGGPVGALLRQHPWSANPLGAPQTWPVALQTLMQIMLASNQPMFIVWGPQQVYLYNDVYPQILGGKHPAALGANFLDAWPEIRSDIAPLVARAFSGEPVQVNDMQFTLHRNGYAEETYFSFFYSPVADDDGRICGIFCAVTERTREILALRELRQSEERHRRVLAKMNEGFLLLDRDFGVVDLNDYALRLVGRTREEMLGRSHWELFPESEDQDVGRLYKQSMADGVTRTLEHLYAWADGRRTWIELRAYPTPDGLAVFFRDVTARKQIEQQAAESSERVQLALDAGAIVGTWVWDIAGDRMVTDERFARTFGLDPDACRAGIPLQDVFIAIHPDDRERVTAAITAAMQRGGPYRCEYRVLQPDARYHLIEANGRCELDAQGRAARFPGVLLDIESRRRVEDERDQANEMLRTFMEAVPGVVYAKDRAGRLLLGNRGTAQLLGVSPENFIGKTDAEILRDPAIAQQLMANDRRIMESGRAEQVEEIVPYPDGTPAHWLSSKAPLLDARGKVIGLIGASVDISDRKREQERARVQAETVDLLNQTGALLAAELNLDVLVQSVTDAATKLTGARFGAFFYNGTDDQGEARTVYALSGASREAFEQIKTSSPPPIFEPTFRGGAPSRVEDVIRDPRYGSWGPDHGMRAGHLSVRSYLAVSVTSRRGEVLGGLCFAHPEPGIFTERSERLVVGIASQAAVAIDNARLYAEAQRAATERTLLLESERAARAEAERASSLKDEFLATLSHELRTPLSAILGWTHLLRKKAGTDPTITKGIEVIERSTRVQTQLIEDLLDMSRITSGKLRLEMEPMAPLTFVQAAIDSVRHAADAARVQVVLAMDDALPVVSGDSARLQQVVWNLLSNAIKFSPAGGDVVVRLGAEGDQVRLEVTDSGIGIAPEFLPFVFDRFRQADGSTTRKFGGLGLGLSIVRHLVDLHGGTVAARSGGGGKGASFVVTLPAHGTSSAVSSGTAADGMRHLEADLRGIKVMVLDDEPDVLELLGRVLAEAGAEVISFNHAEHALRALAEEPPDILVSDIGMPEVDGYELMRRLRATRPASGVMVPAIALTAFARPEDRRRALEAGFAVYLSKPVEPHELLAEVARLAKR